MGNVGGGSDQPVQENSSFCPQVIAGLSFQKAARAPVLAWELGELLSAVLSPWKWGFLRGESFGLAATHACFAGTDGRPHAGPCLLFGEMALFQRGSQQANIPSKTGPKNQGHFSGESCKVRLSCSQKHWLSLTVGF